MHEVETMAYSGEVPWHGLGTRVPDDLSTDQMLEKAGLNWTVKSVPLYFEGEDGPVMTKAHGLIRETDSKLLTVISDKWNPVQNQQAFDFFRDFVNAGDMKMHTAGSLRGGKMVWCLAKIGDSFDVFGGDQIDGFLLFSNPHEFGRSIDIRFTPIRVVCNNTHVMALSGYRVNTEKYAVKVNHRQKFDVDEVKLTMGIAKDRLDEYKRQALFLGSKKYTNETLTEYFNRVFPSLTKDEMKKVDITKNPISRQAEEAMAVIHLQPGAEFAKGTWWQAFNAVTYMTDHKLGRSSDTRLSSAWYGTNRIRKEKAMSLALEYANK